MSEAAPSPSADRCLLLDAEVEAVAQTYLAAARADAQLALRRVITDALAELCEAERRSHRQTRLISHGYVRAALHRTRPL